MSETPERDIGNELYTMNLLTFYNTPSLYESLDDAERYAFAKMIFARLGVQHA